MTTSSASLIGRLGDLELDDRKFLRAIGKIDVQMQASPLERVGHFARVVRGQHDQRNVLGLERAEFGHGHLEVGKQLEQERFELGVGLVDLVDQQDRRLLAGNSLEQRPRQHEALGEEDLVLRRDSIDRLGQALGADQHFADFVLENLGIEELLGVLPFVERLALVEAFVTLKADHLEAERCGQHLGQVGLADAGGAFDQDGLAQFTCQVDDGRDSPAGDIIVLGESLDYVLDR